MKALDEYVLMVPFVLLPEKSFLFVWQCCSFIEREQRTENIASIALRDDIKILIKTTAISAKIWFFVEK